jgi:hypothetical protein
MENDEIELEAERFQFLRTTDVATLVAELNQLDYLFRIIHFDVDKTTGAATAVIDKAPLFVVTREDMIVRVDEEAIKNAVSVTKSA